MAVDDSDLGCAGQCGVIEEFVYAAYCLFYCATDYVYLPGLAGVGWGYVRTVTPPQRGGVSLRLRFAGRCGRLRLT